MSESHLHLAIVGHTNTGKTSLVRTLLHQAQFGSVDDRAGTTTRVSGEPLYIDHRAVMTLYDSPGLENAPALFDWLELHAGSQRHRGPARVQTLLDDADASTRFDQESQVLSLVLGSDVALYVCDAREPVLEKYRDELSILSLCGRPIVVVLNFVASPHSQESQWRAALAQLGQHHIIAFDAMVRNPVTERRLFEQIRSLSDAFVPTIDAWLRKREQEEADRLSAGLSAIAQLLIDATAIQSVIDQDEPMDEAVQALQDQVRRREQLAVDVLLDLYRFGPQDYAEDPLNLSAGRWSDDVFDPDTLKSYGIRAGRYIGTGAGLGAAFDVATGGLSLGTGTLVGAATGAGISAVRQFGLGLVDRLRGQIRLVVDQPTLRLLAWRQMELLRALRQRGHASQTPLSTPAQDQWSAQALPRALMNKRLEEAERLVRVQAELAQAFIED